MLFSSLGGGNPNAREILSAEGSAFAGFLDVVCSAWGPGGSSYDHAISKLDALGSFAGQLVYSASGPIYMARASGDSFVNVATSKWSATRKWVVVR